MRKVNTILPTLMLFSLLLCNACSVVRERAPAAELKNFRTWTNTQASRLTKLSEEEWKQVIAEFKVRTDALDMRHNQLNEEQQAEYRQLKERFHELDKKFTETVIFANWRKQLLGVYADMSTINASNAASAYNYFVDQVRAQCKDWTELMWALTNRVFEDLNNHKANLEARLATDDIIEIKAIQMEYCLLQVLE